MANLFEDDSERTEEATPRKLEEARERGDIPQSREFSSFMLFLGVTLSIYMLARYELERFAGLFKTFWNPENMKIESSSEFITAGQNILWEVALIAGPILGAAMVFGVAGYILQNGFLFSPQRVQMDFSRIDPMAGFGRILSTDTLVEFLKSVIKIFVLGWILYLLIIKETDHLIQLGTLPIKEIFFYMTSFIGKILFASLLFVGVIGLLDFGFQRFRYSERMKMTKEEVKEESKQRDGDPKLKARIRQIQRERSQKRMMDDVPRADVVVTNPTHVAVALMYKKGNMPAPKIVAKGAGVIAQRIKEVAALSGVPVVEKKTLARFLYRNLEIGEFVPESLYTAVAEVLAYVYRIKKSFTQMQQPTTGV